MSISTWQKACVCEGATATSGRIIFSQGVYADGVTYTSAKHHVGPVCDKCDTPWTVVPLDPSSLCRVR